MAYFAVTVEHAENWDSSRGMREQDEWDAHASFMDALVEEGFLVLGGPLIDGDRVLLAVEATDERAVEARLAEDPWRPMGLLRTATVERWEILLDGRA